MCIYIMPDLAHIWFRFQLTKNIAHKSYLAKGFDKYKDPCMYVKCIIIESIFTSDYYFNNNKNVNIFICKSIFQSCYSKYFPEIALGGWTQFELFLFWSFWYIQPLLMVVDYPIFHKQTLIIAVDHENKAKPAIMRRIP